jgi:hypothetical protein
LNCVARPNLFRTATPRGRSPARKLDAFQRFARSATELGPTRERKIEVAPARGAAAVSVPRVGRPSDLGEPASAIIRLCRVASRLASTDR